MRKINLIAILAAMLFISPALGNVTIEPLDPDKGKMLISYQLTQNIKAGTKDFLCRGVYASANKKPDVRFVMDIDSKKSYMAKTVPLKKDGKTVPGKYQVLIRFKEPSPKDTKLVLQLKIVVYNNDLCFIDDDGLWVTKWLTSYKCEFTAPKGHIPTFTSLPVVVRESYGRIQLLQDPLFIQKNNKKLYLRTLVFKTKPLSVKETKNRSQ